MSFGGIDCVQLILWVVQEWLDVDIFVVYIDNEMWVGQVYLMVVFDQYVQKMGWVFKLIVVGLIVIEFSIVDLQCWDMFDVVGFDVVVLNVMMVFVWGEV